MKHTSIRQKGQNGEREIARLLNPIIHRIKSERGYSIEEVSNPHVQVQRNPNQSANGGNDLQNTYGLSIEVKRQQNLKINDWWKQCVKASEELSEIPVLMYRQNNKKWRVVMMGEIGLDGVQLHCRVEISMEDFLKFFNYHVQNRMGVKSEKTKTD